MMAIENVLTERASAALADIPVATPKLSASRTSLPRGGRLCLVSRVAELEALGPAWRALEEQAARASTVFQSHGWCTAWAHHYAGPRATNELCIVTGYQDGALVFVWPLMKAHTGPFTILRWLSEPFAQYGDVLIAPGADARTWLGASFDFIRRLKDIDSIRLRHVRADAAVYPFLREIFRPAGEPDAAPFLDLTPFATEEDYEKRYCKEQRRRRKRIRKELEKIGPVKFELLEAGAPMDRAIDQALDEKRRWLDERGLYSQPVACSLIGPFLRELSRNRSGNPKVVTSRLTAGDRIISWEVGLRFGKTHFGFITAHDTSLTDASPARLHMDMSQKRAIADGMKTFDLMVPADPHKESWSSGQIVVHDFHAPLSLSGRLYGRFYLEWARPLMRRAYFRAPATLRGSFTRVALLSLFWF
jgi:CelD/BcsL family acetyltransferase involved in cellulose biosynthesis